MADTRDELKNDRRKTMPRMNRDEEVADRLIDALEAMNRREHHGRTREQAVARTYLETAMLWWRQHQYTVAKAQPPAEPDKEG